MATKLNNNHLNIIMMQSKQYTLLDTYIALSHVSFETSKSHKFIIQTITPNLSELSNIVVNIVKCSYKTAYNCINSLIHLNILKYESELGWLLVDMEEMNKKKDNKDSRKGYITIRKFFLTPEFQKLKFREKRLLIYMCQLVDSKARKNYKCFTVNLLKSTSKWFSIIKTNSKYYAKYILEDFVKNSFIKDKSEEMRSEDYLPKSFSKFKFMFTCTEIEQALNEDILNEMLKITNEKEFQMIKSKIAFAEITLSKTQIMHIVHSIATIKEWTLKERVVQLIINKYIAIQIYNSRENIKSLPAYLAAIVKCVINEHNLNNSIKNNYNSYYEESVLKYLSLYS